MKKREIVLISILLVLLCVFGFYFLYFVPRSDLAAEIQSRIEQTRQDIDAASNRTIQFAGLTNKKEALISELDALDTPLPKSFDAGDILERIQKIVGPYTEDMSIKIPDTGTQLELTTIYAVEIRCTVPGAALPKILDAFAREDINNRIVNLSYSQNMTESAELFIITMTVDFLAR